MSRETLQFIGVTLAAIPLMVFGLLQSSGEPSLRAAAASQRLESPAPAARDGSPFRENNWSRNPAYRGGPAFTIVEVDRGVNPDLAERLDSIAIGFQENEQ